VCVCVSFQCVFEFVGAFDVCSLGIFEAYSKLFFLSPNFAVDGRLRIAAASTLRMHGQLHRSMAIGWYSVVFENIASVIALMQLESMFVRTFRVK